jgi:large subunit ribosomal protein L15
MTVKRRKKSTRQHKTHGWGANKHRNSGMRGGYGNAGSGKKCDSKKPSNWDSTYFGKHGFVSKGQKECVCTINLRDIEDKLPGWLSEKRAKQEAGTIILDLEELGYNKLLSTGKLTKKIKITVAKAAEGAAEKVKAAGGELVVNK